MLWLEWFRFFLRFSTVVTLCRWSTKQTIPLSVLARNQTKARDLYATGSRNGTPVGVGQRNPEEGSWRNVTRVASRHRTAEVTSWHAIGSRAVREDRSRWVGIPSSFVEILLEIHASISLHMHIRNAMLHNSPSRARINPSILFVWSFVLFPPTPLIVFLVAMKKSAIPLSEPLDDHRPRSEMVWRSWCNVGAEGGS